MRDTAVSEQLLKNVNLPFTEIFSLITKHKTLPSKAVKLSYSNEDLRTMHYHVNNAIDVMLQGLQDGGNLLAAFDRNRMQDIPVESVGSFISTTCNLIEALNGFARNAEYSASLS